MSIIGQVSDWVGELTTTVGTGTVSLSNIPVEGFTTFKNMADGLVWYTILEGFDKETGIGTLTNNQALLERTTVYATLVNGVYSTSGTPMTLAGGASAYCTLTANAFKEVNAAMLKLDSIEDGATADQIAVEVPFTPTDPFKADNVQIAIEETRTYSNDQDDIIRDEVDALDTQNVKITGNQEISGQKRFLDDVYGSESMFLGGTNDSSINILSGVNNLSSLYLTEGVQSTGAAIHHDGATGRVSFNVVVDTGVQIPVWTTTESNPWLNFSVTPTVVNVPLITEDDLELALLDKEDAIEYGIAKQIAVVNTTEDGFSFTAPPDFAFFRLRGTAVTYTGVDPDGFADTINDPDVLELIAGVEPDIVDPDGATWKWIDPQADLILHPGDAPTTVNNGDYIYWSADTARYIAVPSSDGEFVDLVTDQTINGNKTFVQNVSTQAVPVNANHLTTKDYVDAGLSAHTDLTNTAHGATDANLGNTLVARDNVGDSSFLNVNLETFPTAATHATRKDYVDEQDDEISANLTDHIDLTNTAHGATNTATPNTICARDAAGGANFTGLAVENQPVSIFDVTRKDYVDNNFELKITYGFAGQMAVTNITEDGFSFVTPPDLSFYRLRGTAVHYTGVDPLGIADTVQDATVLELIAGVEPAGIPSDGATWKWIDPDELIVLHPGDPATLVTTDDYLYWSDTTARYIAIPASQGEFVDLVTDQSINGNKSFYQNISIAVAPINDYHATRKDYVDGLDIQNVKLTGNQTIEGQKIFTDDFYSNTVATDANILGGGMVSRSGSAIVNGAQTYDNIYQWGDTIAHKAQFSANYDSSGNALYFRKMHDSTDDWQDWDKIAFESYVGDNFCDLTTPQTLTGRKTFIDAGAEGIIVDGRDAGAGKIRFNNNLGNSMYCGQRVGGQGFEVTTGFSTPYMFLVTENGAFVEVGGTQENQTHALTRKDYVDGVSTAGTHSLVGTVLTITY